VNITEQEEITAICRLKARYFRYLDTKDWVAWREVFTYDFECKVDTAISAFGGDGRPMPTISGGDVFVAYVSGLLGQCITMHHGHMPEIEITSPTTATGIWAMEDVVEYPGQAPLRGAGHYHETYRKIDGQWRIATLHLTRIRLENAPDRSRQVSLIEKTAIS
jgi:hypothetical protein